MSHQSARQSARAIINETLSGDGGSSCASRSWGAMNGVASRFSVLLRAGPAIRPSMNGIMAAEAIKDVNRKSAPRRRLRAADKIVTRAGRAKDSARARRARGSRARV